MAKKNNKGFALIEIIIAVAIMTLLLTPIVKQLSQTMQLNRKTKVQQYATENAEYVLEYFKANSLHDLSQITTGNSNGIDTKEFKEHKNQECDIYVLDATGNMAHETTIQYTAYEYLLNEESFGGQNIKFDRRVIMDDLEKSISSIKINYTVDGESKEFMKYYIVNDNNVNITNYNGFSVDEYGKVVKKDSDGIITAIVCSKFDLSKADEQHVAIDSPNKANLGNMFDIDIDQMAVISGESVTFDVMAANFYYSETMKRLKNSSVQTDVDTYNDELEAENPGDVLTPDLYLSNMNKLTKVIVRDTGSMYNVKVVVTYEDTITVGGVDETIPKTYTIKELEYPYNVAKEKPECPDIYFEYQPFAMQSEDELIYAPNDKMTEYIMFDSEVEDVKMYLIKPQWDQASLYVNGFPTLFDDVEDGEVTTYKDMPEDTLCYNKFYAVYNNPDMAESSSRALVRICLVNENNSKPVNVFTNVEYRSDRLTTSLSSNGQFKTNQTSIFNTSFLNNGAKLSVKEFNTSNLHTLDEDENTAEKLYDITVELVPQDTKYNSIVLNGAKGVN